MCNLADCPTKHHAGPHHRVVRPICLHVPAKSPKHLHECEQILQSTKPVPEAAVTKQKQSGKWGKISLKCRNKKFQAISQFLGQIHLSICIWVAV